MMHGAHIPRFPCSSKPSVLALCLGEAGCQRPPCSEPHTPSPSLSSLRVQVHVQLPRTVP
eukprot:2262636-Rhodomonas_salina.2